MRLNRSFSLPLLFLVMLFKSAMGQKHEYATILWKISGKDCKGPSYLLGTFHLADVDWLLEYPEMKKVVDSTEFILTEAFTTVPVDTNMTKPSRLKALPLLSTQQFQLLDSFFVAQVGEGITNNPDAENMTVAEMGSTILMTLTANSSQANGISKFMDLELFKLYQKLGRGGDLLDVTRLAKFKSDDVKNAKQQLARSLGYIKNSDKPDWNPYGMTGVDSIIVNYKKMEGDYKLTEADNFQTSNDFDFVPMEVRNREWMKKITLNIAEKPCLIAVGMGHLWYRISLINLLREQGYRVEPVVFENLH